jgi:hypothetical protein
MTSEMLLAHTNIGYTTSKIIFPDNSTRMSWWLTIAGPECEWVANWVVVMTDAYASAITLHFDNVVGLFQL